MRRERNNILFLLTLLAFSSMELCVAQTGSNSTASFRHARTVVPGDPGPNRLRIDAALLAGGDSAWQLSRRITGSEREPMIIATGGLKDLRIFDSTGREVPYLLIAPPAPDSEWLTGRISPLAATKRTSGFQLDLGRPHLMDRLKVEGLPAPFVKRFSLQASNDGSRWMVLRDDATVFDLPSEKLRSLEIEFSPGEHRHLRAVWDDIASARLPLPRAVSARLVSAGSLPPLMQISVPFSRRGSEPGISRYRISLPGPRLPVTGITLSVKSGNVLRQARVTEGRLSGDEIVPFQLGSAILRRAVRGDLSASEMSVPVAAPREAQLDLVIEDGDNAPLEIEQMSAVFAYLPWIYFESPDAQALTARYGNPRLHPPRYDLEAGRTAAEKAQTAEANWEAEREAPLETAGTAEDAIPDIGSTIDLDGFRYARAISAGKAGLTVLPLDAAILAHSRISDLRIVGTDGRQIPYLLEKMDEPLSLDLPLPEKTEPPRPTQSDNRRGTAGRSYYRLHLPYKSLPPARLVLNTPARIFRRELRILIELNPRDERQEAWTEAVAEATWSHAEQETPAPALTLNIPSIDATEAILIVEEGDNTPLPIASARLLLPSRALRFFRSNGSGLKLYYGRSDLGPPRYDLAILSPQLVGAAAEETRMSPEAEVAAAKPGSLSGRLFWGILIAAVLVMLTLIVRLVKKT